MVYRTFWQRVAAAIIDSILLFPLALMDINFPFQTIWVTVILVVLDRTYYIIGHAQYGQTLGKYICEVKVVRAHENLPIGWHHALLRESLKIVSAILLFSFKETAYQREVLTLVFILFGADAIMAAIHPRNRSIRDFIARTVVVRVVKK